MTGPITITLLAREAKLVSELMLVDPGILAQIENRESGTGSIAVTLSDEAFEELLESIAGDANHEENEGRRRRLDALYDRLQGIQEKPISRPVTASVRALPGAKGLGSARPGLVRRSGQTVHVLRISLEGIQPEVWRRIIVPSSISLKRLHEVLQVVMGWGNYHLHLFITSEGNFGIPDPHYPDGTIDESHKRLDRFLKNEGDRFRYLYDFGDDWIHHVVLEEIEQRGASLPEIRCADGARSCPPEDVGGIPGYEEFLRAIAEEDHPQHREMLEWVGGRFDPEAFTAYGINQALLRLIR